MELILLALLMVICGVFFYLVFFCDPLSLDD